MPRADKRYNALSGMFSNLVNMFNTPEHSNPMHNQMNSLEEHTTDLGISTFPDHQSTESVATITVQPFNGNREQESRRPIPISTIDWRSTNDMQIIAGQGIDFLRGVEQLYIQQTVELSDLMSDVESENRYMIKVPQGETLFYATESSNETQRMCCGTNRAFVMRLFDQTQQEALIIKRSMACGICSFWCSRQSLEVFLPNDQYVGRIVQEYTFSAPLFTVVNTLGIIIYRIEGPSSWSCFTTSKESHFKIFSADGMTQLGSINHVWDQMNSNYNLSLQFPNRQDDTRNKSLLVGAAFLLEYMYFVVAKRAGWRCC